MERFEGVVYRAISGRKPLWWEANHIEGRFNRAAPLRGLPAEDMVATQYLCLHPLGPMSEAIRHDATVADGLRPSVSEVRRLRKTVSVHRVRLEAVLPVTVKSAEEMGIAAAHLLGDDWLPTQRWAAELRARLPRLTALRVPSAALPGTENLVVFGRCLPWRWTGEPTEVRVPSASAAVDAHPLELLARIVHRVGMGTHPALGGGPLPALPATG